MLSSVVLPTVLILLTELINIKVYDFVDWTAWSKLTLLCHFSLFAVRYEIDIALDVVHQVA